MNDLDPKLRQFAERAVNEIPVPALVPVSRPTVAAGARIIAIATAVLVLFAALGAGRILEQVRVGFGGAGASARPAPSSACPRTQTRDTMGVVTRDGVVGIDGDTLLPPSDNEAFFMLRRAAKLGDRAAVRFEQIGTSAPATAVSYDVSATTRQNSWGSAVFELGVKPIGFPNSCWRLIVDDSDTGIVLEIGA